MVLALKDHELARRRVVANNSPAGCFHSNRRAKQLRLELRIGTEIPVDRFCQFALRFTAFAGDAGSSKWCAGCGSIAGTRVLSRRTSPAQSRLSPGLSRGHLQPCSRQPPRACGESYTGQFVRAHRDDSDHRGAYAIEDCLHPGEAAKLRVGPAERHNHQERRQDKSDTGRRCTDDAVMDVAEINAELCGERIGII